MVEKITFKNQKIVKVGFSFYILIPKAFIKTNLLDKDKKYKVIFEEEE